MNCDLRRTTFARSSIRLGNEHEGTHSDKLLSHILDDWRIEWIYHNTIKGETELLHQISTFVIAS